MRLSLILAAAVVIAWTGVASAQIVFHVSPNGDDANLGAPEKPFRTLHAARDAIRALKQTDGLPEGGATVLVAPGQYVLSGSLQLEAQDSGEPGKPVAYRAQEPGVSVLRGGRDVPPSAFEPVKDAAILERIDASARAVVREADLKALGITDYGPLDKDALGGGPMMELFFNAESMPLACWPNEGWAVYGKVLDKGSRPRWNEKPERPGVFKYEGDRPSRWLKADEVWLHGYWCYDWYDDMMKVARIDTEKQTIAFEKPHMYGLAEKRRYRAVNLLEELDRPGEWYLDRKTGVLYFWPPSDLESAEIAVSMLAAPMVRVDGASHVTVDGFVFELTRGSGVNIRGGSNCKIVRCTFRNLGTSAVSVTDGLNHRVAACEVHGVGTSGISVAGGDRPTLAPANHAVVNNHIHHYSRRKKTNAPAIALNGVGNRAAHNLIHDAPHCGINYYGNEHVIESNEVHDICQDTGDVGVFYSGRDWTCRGNIIRHNFVHHIQAPGHGSSMSVYLDDCHSSTASIGNVFYKVQRAVFVGGGRDNIARNNIFVECDEDVTVDTRGLGWAAKYQERGGDHKMYEKLTALNYDKPPYSERYPALARILDEDPHAPMGNVVECNVSVNSGWQKFNKYVVVGENFVTKKNPGFVDMAKMDFALREDSVVFDKLPEFEPIPLDQIGLVHDANGALRTDVE
ncbi:MAG: hypothetical protein GY851_17590 [bacterium]|nr:hypothetical protein [bacterium]